MAQGKKTDVFENTFKEPVKKSVMKQKRPLTRAAKADIKKTTSNTSTSNVGVNNRFKSYNNEEAAISEAILNSELISSSNENQNEVMTSFSSDNVSSMFDSSLNESLTLSGKRKSRPVPNIPIEILKDSPVPEVSAVNLFSFIYFSLSP